MQTISYTITDPQGVHARPATQLVKVLNGFASSVTAQKGAQRAAGKSIMGLMSLKLAQGETLTLAFDGADEQQAAQAALAYLQENF